MGLSVLSNVAIPTVSGISLSWYCMVASSTHGKELHLCMELRAFCSIVRIEKGPINTEWAKKEMPWYFDKRQDYKILNVSIYKNLLSIHHIFEDYSSKIFLHG